MNLIDERVLNFYRKSPFNIYGDIEESIKRIKKINISEVYPCLKDVLENQKIKNVLDFGCGGGWFANTIAYHYDFNVYGLDFNEEAIKYSQRVSERMKIKTQLINSDLFKFESNLKFDLITSLGVLHHTHDCSKAIDQMLKFGSEKSFIFLGLYHKYGRKPFLDFVKNIGALNEKQKFEKYKKLHKLSDEKHLYSWFYDQVLHPHETQHTYEEIYPIFERTGYRIISTSINNFKKYNSHQEIIDKEKLLINYAKTKMDNNEYYPGFFVVLAKNF